jgi:hypothetical protein
MITFWDIAPCILIGVDRRFRGVSIIRAMNRPDNGGSMPCRVILIICIITYSCEKSYK